MALKTIEQEWQEFSRYIFTGISPSPIQVEETKRAFFAGSFSLLMAVREIGEPHINEDEGCEYLEERYQESMEFYEQLKERHAKRN